MATVIDALMINLGLNSKGVQSGMKQAQNAITSGIKGIASALGPILGGLAFKGLLDNYVQTADALGKLSRMLGENISDVDAWGKAATLAGGSAEGFQSSLKNLNQGLQKISTGGKGPAAASLEALGVSATDATGKAKKSTDVLLELAGVAEKMDSAKFAGLAARLGLDQGTIMLLQQGRGSVEDVVRQMRALALEEQDAEGVADNYNDQMVILQWTFQKLVSVVMREVVPILTKFAAGLTHVIGVVTKNKALLYGVFAGLGAVVMTKVVAAFKVLNAVMRANPLGIIITLVAGLLLLLDDFLVWFNGGESALGEYWQKIANFFTSVKAFVGEAWEWVKAKADWLWTSLKEAPGEVWEAIKSGLGSAVDWIKEKISAAWDWITSTAEDLWETMKAMPADFASKVGGFISDAVALVTDLIGSAVDWIVDALVSLWDDVSSAPGKFVDAIGEWFSEALTKAGQFGSDILQSIGEAFQNVFNEGKRIFQELWDWIVGLFKNIGGAIWDGIKGIGGKIGGAIGGAWDSVKGLFGGGDKAAKEVGAGLAESGGAVGAGAEVGQTTVNQDNSSETTISNTITVNAVPADQAGQVAGDAANRASQRIARTPDGSVGGAGH